MAVLNLSGLIFSDTSNLYSKYGIVESQTTMVFYQASAPTGWVKKTDHDNKALRVVSGVGSATGGTNPFTATFPVNAIPISAPVATGGGVGNYTLTTSEIASHTHTAGSVNANFAAGPATPSRYSQRSPISYGTRAFYNTIVNYQRPQSYRQPSEYRQPQAFRQPSVYQQPNNVQNPNPNPNPSQYRKPYVQPYLQYKQYQNPFQTPVRNLAQKNYANPVNRQNPFGAVQNRQNPNPVNRQNPNPVQTPNPINISNPVNRQQSRREVARAPYNDRRPNRRGRATRNNIQNPFPRRQGFRVERRFPYSFQNPTTQNRRITENRRNPNSTQATQTPAANARVPARSPSTTTIINNVLYQQPNRINARSPKLVVNQAFKTVRNTANKQYPKITRTPTNTSVAKNTRIIANTRILADKRVVANKNVPYAQPLAVRYPQVNNSRYVTRILVPGGQIRGTDNTGPDSSSVGGGQAHNHPFVAGFATLSTSITLRVQYIDVILCYFN